MFACRKKAEKDNKPKLKYDECDDKKKKKKNVQGSDGMATLNVWSEKISLERHLAVI